MNHFLTQELVPTEIYEKFGEYAIYKLDKNLLITLNLIHDYFGGQPITINNAYIGGQFNYRGYRPDDYKNNASKSMHFFGKAFDFDIKGFPAEEVRQVILKNYKKFPFITRMEHIDKKTNKPINWVHIDSYPTGKSFITLFDI